MNNEVNVKEIAIVTRKMITGGVEKALIGMLKKLDNKELHIDLYVEEIGGDLFDKLPNNINVIKIPSNTLRLKYLIKHPIKFIYSIYSRAKIRFKKVYLEQCENFTHCYPVIEKKYDVAISYHAPNTIPVFYTINNLKASKKILWLHGDLEANNCLSDVINKYYTQYDNIFSVSKDVKKSFDSNFPELINKSELFYNYVDVEEIKFLSKEKAEYPEKFSGIKILTIGRLDKQKGYDLAVDACHKLKEDGYNFKWYICGEGNYRKELEDLITRKCLRGNFILLGNKKNPYKYLKDCDIYVQTSRFEGYCTTTNEARILLKPVVTTNVSGADEQFINGKSGIITSITVEGIYEGLKLLIDNIDKRNELSNNLSKILNNNIEDIEKLSKIIFG